jgi:predicted nucleotidyltransferase
MIADPSTSPEPAGKRPRNHVLACPEPIVTIQQVTIMVTEQPSFDQTLVNSAIRLILESTPAGSQVILFGSQADGSSNADSDIDLLVIQDVVKSRRKESARLHQLLRPLRIPADILVVDRAGFEAWKDQPNNIVHEAWTKGRMYAQSPNAGTNVSR